MAALRTAVRGFLVALAVAGATGCGGGGGDAPPPPSCRWVLSSTSASVSAAGATGSVDVTAAGGCAWTATSGAPWITVDSGASGSGSGTVSFTVAANPDGPARTGTLTVAGQAFTVEQAGLGCDPVLVPTTATAAAAGGTATVDVSLAPGCPWTATSGAAWIAVTAGASGAGDGTVQYSVAANASSAPRSGTIAIAGRTVTVDQEGAACAWTLVPGSASFTAAGGTGSVGVTAPGGCAWTAASDQAWLTVDAGTPGSGDGTVQFAVAANAASTSRSATIAIADQSFTVTQGGAACTYAVAPATASVGASAGAGSFTVTAPGGCAWSAASGAAWLTVTSAGSGSGGVQYGYTANPAASPREGTIAVAGEIHTVTQAAAACAYALLPASASAPAQGGVGSFALTAPSGCAWTATSSDAWLSVTSAASGDGAVEVSWSAAANAGAGSRTATITAGGETFTVTQAGVGCTFGLSAAGAAVGSGGASLAVDVTSLAGCAWAASSGAGWISVVGGASGDGGGTVQLSVEANPTALARSGTVTIAGLAYTVDQDAAPCSYALVPAMASFTAAGGSGSLAVDTLEGCGWSVVNDAAWLTVIGTTAGSGDGVVRFAVAENAGAGSRLGTLDVAGETFTVSQGGVSCTYGLSPSSASIGAGASAGSVAVSSPAGCTWTAAADVAWIGFPAGAAGEGSATLAYAVGANPAAASRSGTVTVAGAAHTVTQAAAPCSYAILPLSGSYPPAGGLDAVAVSAPTGCGWTATSGAGWVTVAAGASGDGSGTVTLSVAPNGAAASRSTTVTVAGQAFAVTQGGASCAYAIDPSGVASVAAAGASGTVAVTAPAGCDWSSASGDAWLEVAGTGSGSGSATYTVAANAGTTSRAGTATIAGQAFTATQLGAPCAYAVSPGAASLSAAAGSGAFTVLAGAGCPWTAASSAPGWLTVTGAGTGTGTGLVGFAVAEHLGTAERSATISVAGQAFAVTQRPTEVIIIVQ